MLMKPEIFKNLERHQKPEIWRRKKRYLMRWDKELKFVQLIQLVEKKYSQSSSLRKIDSRRQIQFSEF